MIDILDFLCERLQESGVVYADRVAVQESLAGDWMGEPWVLIHGLGATFEGHMLDPTALTRQRIRVTYASSDGLSTAAAKALGLESAIERILDSDPTLEDVVLSWKRELRTVGNVMVDGAPSGYVSATTEYTILMVSSHGGSDDGSTCDATAIGGF